MFAAIPPFKGRFRLLRDPPFRANPAIDYLVGSGIGYSSRLKRIAVYCEISFARYSCQPKPLRTLEEIRADIPAVQNEAEGLLDEPVQGASK